MLARNGQRSEPRVHKGIGSQLFQRSHCDAAAQRAAVFKRGFGRRGQGLKGKSNPSQSIIAGKRSVLDLFNIVEFNTLQAGAVLEHVGANLRDTLAAGDSLQRGAVLKRAARKLTAGEGGHGFGNIYLGQLGAVKGRNPDLFQVVRQLDAFQRGTAVKGRGRNGLQGIGQLHGG